MTDSTPSKTMPEHERALHEKAIRQHQQALREHEQALQGPNSANLLEKEARSVLPSVSSVVQAGAFGAALGGMTTGVMEMARVKQGEITSDEAIQNVVKSSAQGATTMAVASVASQVVRSHPVFGFIALAAAGIGAFVILSGASKKKPQTVTAAVTEFESGDGSAPSAGKE